MPPRKLSKDDSETLAGFRYQLHRVLRFGRRAVDRRTLRSSR
jgi:hypothetical protein